MIRSNLQSHYQPEEGSQPEMSPLYVFQIPQLLQHWCKPASAVLTSRPNLQLDFAHLEFWAIKVNVITRTKKLVSFPDPPFDLSCKCIKYAADIDKQHSL